MQPFSEPTGKVARCDPSYLRPRLGFAWGHATVDKVILRSYKEFDYQYNHW
jgi:hypothetical protein